MSRITPHLRRLIGLCLLGAAFALVEVVAIPAATEGQGKELEPPTLLWKSYPLQQRPSTADQVGAQVRKAPVPAQTSTQPDDFPTPALLGGFILLLAAAAVVFRRRRSAPIRRDKARPTADRVQEVIPEVVEKPRAQALQPPSHRSAADLLNALQPQAPSLPPPKLEPMPKVAATSHDEAPPEAPGRSLESELDLELWTSIADVDLVPVPGPKPQTPEELPPT